MSKVKNYLTPAHSECLLNLTLKGGGGVESGGRQARQASKLLLQILKALQEIAEILK